MGGIPTGSDPSGYDIEGWDGPVVGAGLGALQARTEGAIKDMLQQRVSNNTTLKEFSDRVFEGLDATLGIVVAPIKALVEKMFPFIDFDGVLTMEELLALVQHIPLIGDFVELILGIEDGDEDDLGTFFLHLRQFFEGVNFLDPDFDPRDAAQVFVNTVVNPFVSTIQRISAAILGVIPIGLLSAETPTLLLEGEFDDPVTIVEGSGFVHDATDGATTPLGCAKAEADGTHIVMATELIKVAPGWKLAVASKVKWEDLETDGDDAIRINIIPYADEETPASGGSVMAASVQSASGDSTGTNGWGTTISGTYTVPSSGVAYVSVELHVTDDATAGSVKYDNVTLKSTEKIPQSFTKDLVEDLTTLWNGLGSLVDQLLDSLGITPVGDLLARIFDLSDEIAWIQEKARDGADDAAQALSDLADLAGDLLTNPGAVIGTITQGMVSGLTDIVTQTNQIMDILGGAIVTPINSAVQAVKDWFSQWLGGGSTQAIPLSQKSAAWGVCPLDGNKRVPLDNMPLGYEGGDGETAKPTTLKFELPSDVSVATSTETTLTSWVQKEGTPITMTSGAFKLPSDGWWDIEAHVVWDTNTTGVRQTALVRSIGGVPKVVLAAGMQAAESPFYAPRQSLAGKQDNTSSTPLSTNDTFSVNVWQNSGSARLVKGGAYPDGSYLLAVRRANKDAAAGGAQNLYVHQQSTNAVFRYSLLDNTSSFIGSLGTSVSITGMAIDSASGDVYGLDNSSKRIVKLVPNVGLTAITVNYSSGSGTRNLYGLALDDDGNMYFGYQRGTVNRIIKKTPDGTETEFVVLGSSVSIGDLHWRDNSLFYVDDLTLRVWPTSPDGETARTLMTVEFGMSVDASMDGKVYVVDTFQGGNYMGYHDLAANTSTPVTTAVEPVHVATDQNNNLYYSVYGGAAVRRKAAAGGTESVLMSGSNYRWIRVA
ncbi:minor tail protein [Mycobacterium phage Skinny]|nr:minor tail protein [Mycobacterium phage Skinny]